MFLYCIAIYLLLCWLCNLCLCFLESALYKPIKEPCVLFPPVCLNMCFFTYKLSLSGEVNKTVVSNMILLSCYNEEVCPNTFSFCRWLCFFTFSYSVLVRVLRNWQHPCTLVCSWKPTKRHEVQQFLIRIQYNWTKSIFSFFFCGCRR